MTHKIKNLFRKAYNKLFRKETHRTTCGQKFDGWVLGDNSLFQHDTLTKK